MAMATIYGAFRTDTTLSTGQVQFGGVGSTFTISSYSSITFNDGVDPNTIEGDGVVNEVPDDLTQTYLGNAFAWDYNYEVTDGTNNYTIGVFDYDSGGNDQFNGGAEQGFFIGFLGSVPPLNTTLTISALGDGAFSDPNVNQPVNNFVPCFTNGTKLTTRHGEKSVENLLAGDELLTFSDSENQLEFSKISRVFHRRLSKRDLCNNPKLRPIRIMAGSLGEGLPKQDLSVSRQHRMLIKSKIAQRMFEQNEVLVSAIKLVELPGIFIDEDVKSVEYFHLLFNEHKIVFAEGAPTESLFTGPEALNAISPEAREEIINIFPEISGQNYTPKPARLIPSDNLQKQLIMRHQKNRKALFCRF